MPMITRRGLAAAALAPLAVPVAAQGAAISRIAFGTCADEKLPQPLWRAVRAWQPEFFIFDDVRYKSSNGGSFYQVDSIDYEAFRHHLIVRGRKVTR